MPSEQQQDQLVMQIAGLAASGRSEFDGQWIVDYDPTIWGSTPSGAPMIAHLVCTRDRDKARRFPDVMAAHAYYGQESGRPYPADKPLSAFHIVIEPYITSEETTTRG